MTSISQVKFYGNTKYGSLTEEEFKEMLEKSKIYY